MSLKPIILKGEQKRILFLPSTKPIQIKGVAGSGKTTVSLYRAKHLLDTQSNLFQGAKVVIFTFNKTLVKYIESITPYILGGYQQDSEELLDSTPGLDIKVTNFHKWAYGFITNNGTSLSNRTISGNDQKSLIENIIQEIRSTNEKFDSNILEKKVEFFIEEISWIKGKDFKFEKEYVEAQRIGRGTTDRVTKIDKEVIWKVYSGYNAKLRNNNKFDFDDYALLCLRIIESNPDIPKPFTHIVVDEAQDLTKAQMLVISKIISNETESITIIADAAQRIYKSGFTWSEVGLNLVGGRTIELKKNYRNTSQIVKTAKSLIDNENDRSDFTEIILPSREGNQKPILGKFQWREDQNRYLINELSRLKNIGEIKSTVILHRTNPGLYGIKSNLNMNGFVTRELRNNSNINFDDEIINLCTLSSIKGLEFDNVFVIDVNEDYIPYPPGFNEENDEYHISTERRLLYTSMTRARERLYLLSNGTPSRYLDEINQDLVELVN